MYSSSKTVHEGEMYYYATSCILHGTPITIVFSSPSAHTAIHTYTLFVQGQHDDTLVDSIWTAKWHMRVKG